MAPRIYKSDGIEALIKVLVSLSLLTHILLGFEPRRYIPRVISCAGEVRHKETLVVGEAVGNKLLDVFLQVGFGIPKVVNLFHFGFVMGLLVELSLCKDVLESDLGNKDILPIVCIR